MKDHPVLSHIRHGLLLKVLHVLLLKIFYGSHGNAFLTCTILMAV